MKKIGIVGCGLMGRGIAEVCAKSGYETVVREVSNDFLAPGLEAISKSLDFAVNKGKLEAADAEAARVRISGTVELADLADCDLVIEAIVEDQDAKLELFGSLDELCQPSCLFASNTSSLTLTPIAASTQRPGQFFGLHFFNPVPVMKLVEVVKTILTADETVVAGKQFVESLGKKAVECPDTSGFIVNRLLVPYLLDAIRAYEEGVGTLEDIDAAMKLGCGHPMGPFTLLDFIGLDTTYFIANIMFDEFREKRFAPPPLLKQMVQAGRLGRKSGRGFYDYSAG